MADVAKRAGVSTATVSRVLNDNGYINPKTRERVLMAVQELGYRPNLIASALMTKRTNTVGLLVPEVRNPFFAEVASAVEAAAQAKELNLIIYGTADDPEREIRGVEVLRQKGIDGLIMFPSMHGEGVVKELLRDRFPLCLVARDFPTLPANSIRVDDFRGAYMATKHLVDLGHERLAMVVGEPDLHAAQERIRGFRQAVREAGRGEGRVIEAASVTLEAGVAAGERLIEAVPRPTAVFTYNDMIAIGVLRALHREGIDVPGEMSVVGFDGTVLASVVSPPLTTVVQPVAEMGRTAIDMICEPQRTARRVTVEPQIRMGESTAPPPTRV